MTERWVINASPPILLARIGQEGLLGALAEEVVVPQEVAGEILAGPETDPARAVVASGRLKVVSSPEPAAELMAWDLGKGETSVLAYALADSAWTAILDDGALAVLAFRSRARLRSSCLRNSKG